MVECNTSPVGGIACALGREPEMLSNKTVPTLFVSTALSNVMMQLLSETADDGLLMIVHVTDGDRLDLDSGLGLYTEMLVLDVGSLRCEPGMSLNMAQDVLPDLRIDEELPYWQQVNGHPRRTGPNQRQGGKPLHAQKPRR